MLKLIGEIAVFVLLVIVVAFGFIQFGLPKDQR